MPHNRTRLWVGLAIIAVTIPAVGLSVYSLTNGNTQPNAVALGDQWSAGSQLRPLRGARSVPTKITSAAAGRDYLSEVAGLVRRNNPNAADGTLAERTQINEQNTYDDGSMDDMLGDDEAYTLPGVNDLPDPADTMAPNDGTQGVGSDFPTYVPQMDGGFVPPSDDGTVIADEGPSDGQIYGEMLASFSPQDRDTFVRTWALMSDEQRQEVLDDYRNNN